MGDAPLPVPLPQYVSSLRILCSSDLVWATTTEVVNVIVSEMVELNELFSLGS